MLQHTLDALLGVPGLENIVVTTHADHAKLFARLDACHDARVQSVDGADLRAGSVASGVAVVRAQAGDDAWVLVHDAARPLVSVQDIVKLIDAVLGSDSIGGLLATPVQDTLKKSNATSGSTGSVSRDGLWLAQTPQLFRAGQLGDAIDKAIGEHSLDAGTVITDEASVFEMLDHSPLLVAAENVNIKITTPQDFLLAEAILAMRSA